jgi:hypothetical protein
MRGCAVLPKRGGWGFGMESIYHKKVKKVLMLGFEEKFKKLARYGGVDSWQPMIVNFTPLLRFEINIHSRAYG